MAHKGSRPSFVEKDEDPQTSSENPPDSSLSGDDACRAAAATTATTASPSFNKKRRRGIQKRVVSVPIGELGGSRSSSTISKGDAYPPSDSWTWRKYGQKPIKGSPYPRGYYRCSSSKGCPARKQVERSHVDPAVLVITYASDHNHPTPTSSKHHQHHHRNLNSCHNSSLNGLSSFIPTAAAAAVTDSSDAEAAAPTTPSTTNSAAAGNDMPSDYSEELFTDPVPDRFEMDGDTLLGAGTTMPTFEHFSWLTDVVSFDDLYLVGPRCDDADMAMLPVMREEDELLFADLGELPECSAVFRSGRGMEIKV